MLHRIGMLLSLPTMRGETDIDVRLLPSAAWSSQVLVQASFSLLSTVYLFQILFYMPFLLLALTIFFRSICLRFPVTYTCISLATAKLGPSVDRALARAWLRFPQEYVDTLKGICSYAYVFISSSAFPFTVLYICYGPNSLLPDLLLFQFGVDPPYVCAIFFPFLSLFPSHKKASYPGRSYHGPPDYKCTHCFVVFWFCERAKNQSSGRAQRFVYKNCCRGGKICLPAFR